MFPIFDHTAFGARERELRQRAEHRRRFIDSLHRRAISIAFRRRQRSAQVRDRRAA